MSTTMASPPKPSRSAVADPRSANKWFQYLSEDFRTWGQNVVKSCLGKMTPSQRQAITPTLEELCDDYGYAHDLYCMLWNYEHDLSEAVAQFQPGNSCPWTSL